MDVGQLLLKNIGSIILVIGLAFSVYHNIKSNKEKSDSNEKKIIKLEGNTLSFINMINSMFVYIKEQGDGKAAMDKSIRRVHERIEENKRTIDETISDLRKEYVSHKYLDATLKNNNDKG